MPKKANKVEQTVPSLSQGDASAGLEAMQEKFEEELQWCIDQLELGLQTQNPDSRQAAEAVKVLKILCSSKAPLVKKRQAMRNTFGDYRAKMRKEQTKSAAAAKKMKLTAVDESDYTKSQFFKKSASQKSQNQSTQNSSASTDHDIAGLEVGKSGDDLNESFKFNFSITETVTDESTKCDQTVLEEEKLDISKSGAESGSGSSFKMEKSDNAFRFHFDMSDKT